MLYFRHDTDASKGDDLNDLRCTCGGAAVDCYWYILEQIYKEETHWVYRRNQRANPSVLRFFQVDEKTFLEWIDTMLSLGLFHSVADNDGSPVALMSSRAMAEIETYRRRAEIARENGKKGGRKPAKKKGPKTKSVSKSEPKANRGKTDGATDDQAKRREDMGSSEEEPNIYKKGGSGVENSPSCPTCGKRLLPDPQTGALRCSDMSCPGTMAKPAHNLRFGLTALCPSCNVKCHLNSQSGRLECPSCLNTYSTGEALWR